MAEQPVPEVLERLSIYPVLTELISCLCTRVGTSCFCGIVAGEQVPIDFVPVVGTECDGAAAYVRVSTGFTAANFPQPDQDPRVRGPRGYNIAVGILRPAPIGDRDGVNADEEAEFNLRLLADMQITWESFVCCVNDQKFPDLQYTSPTFQWADRAGGAGGGEWVFQVQP